MFVVLLHGGDKLARACLGVFRGPFDGPHGHRFRRRDAERGLHHGRGPLPGFRRWERFCPQSNVIRQRAERLDVERVGAAVARKRLIGLPRVDKDHEVCCLGWQAHGLGVVDPAPQMRHLDLCRSFLGDLLREVRLPVIAEHEMVAVFAQHSELQRVGDPADQWPQRRLHVDPAAGLVESFQQLLTDLLHVRDLDLGPEIRCRRILEGERLGEQAGEGIAERDGSRS